MAKNKEFVYRVRKGRLVPVDMQVLRWRRKIKAFDKNRKALYSLLLDKLGSADKVIEFMTSPHADLGNAPPKQFLNPNQCRRLLRWAMRLFKNLNNPSITL